MTNPKLEIDYPRIIQIIAENKDIYAWYLDKVENEMYFDKITLWALTENKSNKYIYSYVEGLVVDSDGINSAEEDQNFQGYAEKKEFESLKKRYLGGD